MFLKVEGSWLYSTRLLKLRRRGVHEPILFVLRAWQYALNECKDTAPVMDDEALSMMEETIKWDGEDGALIAAFRSVGVLEDNTFALWWEDGAEALNIARTRARNKKRKQRAESKPDPDKRPKTPALSPGTIQMSPGTSQMSLGTNLDETVKNQALSSPMVNNADQKVFHKRTNPVVPGDNRNVPGDKSNVPGDNPGTRRQSRVEESRVEKSVKNARVSDGLDSAAFEHGPDDDFVGAWGMVPAQSPATPAFPPVGESAAEALRRWCKHACEVCKGASDPEKLWRLYIPRVGKLLAKISAAHIVDAIDEHLASRKGWGRGYGQAWKTLEGFARTLAAQDGVMPKAKPRKTPKGAEYGYDADSLPDVVERKPDRTPIEAWLAEFRRRSPPGSEIDVNGYLGRLAVGYRVVCDRALPEFWAFWDSEHRARPYPGRAELEMYLLSRGLPSPKQRQGDA
jgi:hypothetical protein